MTSILCSAPANQILCSRVPINTGMSFARHDPLCTDAVFLTRAGCRHLAGALIGWCGRSRRLTITSRHVKGNVRNLQVVRPLVDGQPGARHGGVVHADGVVC